MEGELTIATITSTAGNTCHNSLGLKLTFTTVKCDF
jgi:hypothetical protein